jgi:hypothetical protein
VDENGSVLCVPARNDVYYSSFATKHSVTQSVSQLHFWFLDRSVTAASSYRLANRCWIPGRDIFLPLHPQVQAKCRGHSSSAEVRCASPLSTPLYSFMAPCLWTEKIRDDWGVAKVPCGCFSVRGAAIFHNFSPKHEMFFSFFLYLTTLYQLHRLHSIEFCRWMWVMYWGGGWMKRCGLY